MWSVHHTDNTNRMNELNAVLLSVNLFRLVLELFDRIKSKKEPKIEILKYKKAKFAFQRSINLNCIYAGI